jgi:putative hydrolase of HD superfamily
MDDAKLAELARFVYEMGFLKRLPRTGWLVAGVRHTESIAEHSFRTAVIGYLVAHLEGANPERTALICLFHDSHESRTGDAPYISRPYLTIATDEMVNDEQVAGFPQEIGQHSVKLSLDAPMATA